MRKLLLAPIALMFCFCGYSQTRGLKSNYNTDNAPQISFEWNDSSPEIREESDFKLKENDQILSIDALLTITDIPERNKKILFLWEDMASHTGQYDFARRVITGFLEGDLSQGDKFNIAVFNRDETGKKLVKPLHEDGFTSSSGALLKVRNYTKDIRMFKPYPNDTDINRAIGQSIDLFGEIHEDEVGVIVIITKGFNFHGSGGNVTSPTEKALKKGIPVYMIRFSDVDDGSGKGIYDIVNGTYGESIVTQKSDEALAALKNFYRDMNKRQYGNDYRITFTTNAKHDGVANKITLFVKGEQHDLSLPLILEKPVNIWIQINIWIKDHTAIFVTIVVVFVILLVIIILLIIRRHKRQKAAIAEIENIADTANQKAEEAEAKAKQIERDTKQKEAERQRKENEEKQRTEEERLAKLMNIKNYYPRLQCVLGSDRQTFTIKKPTTTIGRLPENDLVLDKKTVSRTHAKIVFTGAGFEITNLSETNKVILNGKFIEQSILKSGDIIGLGEVAVTFYL